MGLTFVECSFGVPVPARKATFACIHCIRIYVQQGHRNDWSAMHPDAEECHLGNSWLHGCDWSRVWYSWKWWFCSWCFCGRSTLDTFWQKPSFCSKLKFHEISLAVPAELVAPLLPPAVGLRLLNRSYLTSIFNQPPWMGLKGKTLGYVAPNRLLLLQRCLQMVGGWLFEVFNFDWVGLNRTLWYRFPGPKKKGFF